MGKKLFVGGLAWSTSDESLGAYFGAVGPVEEAKVITDRDTGRSRGFGFVTYSDDSDANKAIEEFDAKEFEGRTIKVNEAEEKPRGGGNRGGGHRSGGGGGGSRGGYGGGGGNRW